MAPSGAVEYDLFIFVRKKSDGAKIRARRETV